MKLTQTSRIALLLVALLTITGMRPVRAQISNFEYFFDADPGLGNGIPVGTGFTPGNAVAFTMQVPVNGLNPGFHQLFFRARMANGQWSQYQTSAFYVTSFTAGNGDLTSAEYFFDADPGTGLATALPITGGGVVNETVSIPANGLASGFHTLCIRAKNNNNVWGHYQQRAFYVTTISAGNGHLAGAEYFFDTDPGTGNAAPIALVNADTANQTIMIPATGLSLGFHRLYLRVQNNNGVWSHYQTRSVFVTSFNNGSANIAGAEYYIDVDPGNGQGTPVIINPAVDSVDQTFTLTLPATLSEGDHRLVVRVKNELGQWSHYQTADFYTPTPKPGSGNALNFDGSNDYLSIPTTGFTGLQTYSIEFWLKSMATNNGTHVFESNTASAPSLEGNAATGLNYWVGNNASISTGPIVTNQWYHIACTYDRASGLQQLFVNGVLKGSNTVSVNDTLGSEISFMARALSASNQRNFAGSLDEVRIWDKALSQTEVRDRMCRKMTSADPLWANLKAYYNFDEPNGNRVYSATLGAGTLMNGVARETSGAAIGDISAHDYTSPSPVVTLANPVRGDALTATLNSGTTDGLQVYCVTDTPNNTAGTTCLGSNNGYFGVFSANGSNPSFEAVYNYTGIGSNGLSEGAFKLFTRDDNASAPWLDAMAVPDTANNTLTTASAFRGEYVVSNAVVAPTISIVSDAAGSICTGTSVTFTATITNGGTTPVYQWKKNGINVGTSAPAYTDNALQNADSITCELTSNSTCVSPALVASNAIIMQVTSTLVASVTATVVPGTTVCSGTLVTFTAVPVNGGNAPVYQWKINGIASGGNAGSYTSSTLQQGDVVTVEMSTNATCAGPSLVSSTGIAMNVTAQVIPTISIAADTNAICQGSTVTFTASITDGGSAPLFQWKKNGLNVGSNSDTYTDNSLTSTDVVTCILTSNAPCASPAVVAANSIVTTVHPTAQPTITISSNVGNTICAGEPVTFGAASTNGGMAPVYQWLKNGNNVGNDAAAYTDNGLQDGDVITCTITSSEVCATPNNNTSNGIVMTVRPYVTPAIAINASPDDTVCAGATISFTANVTHGGTSPAYQWTKNGAAVSNASSYIANNLATGDVINCTLTSNAACVTTTTATADSIDVTVNPLPVVSAGPDQTILQGSSVQLMASGATNYLWSNGDTTATTIVAPISTTTYTVTATNEFGCSASDEAIVQVNFSAISVNVSSHNFGDVVLNTPTVYNITFTNNGTLTETISSAATVAPFSASFTSQSLAPNTSLTIPVTFAPTGTLIYQDAMTVATTAGNFTIVLQGRGVAPAPAWNVSPIGYAFTNVIVGDSASHLFAVTNTGNVPININSVLASNPVFEGSVLNSVVPVGSQVYIQIKFKPIAIAAYSDIINVSASTPGLAPLQIAVNGAGYVPATPPVIKYVAAPPYNNISGVDFSVAPAGAFTYRVVYSSAAGKPPMAGFPQVGIDKNADGDFLDNGEGVYAMNQIGNGTDWVNGETFTYTTNLSLGNNYGYQFFAKDTLGNVATTIHTGYKPGPTVTNQSLDLAIYANDITFSNSNPGVGQQFTVSAVVHNNSPYSASNVPVRFYKDSVFLASDVLPFIAANSTATITHNFSFSPDGFYPIKVWIDSAATLGEQNILNNYAIRPVIVGNFSLPGTINITRSSSTQSCPSPGVLISGYATYAGLNLQGNPPVLGGTVTVQIAGGPTLSTYTVTGGYWSVFYSGFPCGINQSYTVSVTDYTLAGNAGAAAFNAACQSCTGSSIYYYVGGSGSAPSGCLTENQSFQYNINLTNPCNADTARNDTTYVYANGLLAYTHVVAQLAPCETVSYSDPFTLAAGSHTLSFTHISYDTNGRHEFSQSYGLTVQPNLPDMYLGNFSQTAATSFNVRDVNGTCINAGAHRVYLSDSMSTGPRVLLDSFVVPGVAAQGFQTISYSNPALQMGYHYLQVITDPDSVLSERNEDNNVLNVLLYVPFPELTIDNVQMSSSNIQAGAVVNFSATVHNNGSAASGFNVQFMAGNLPIGNKVPVVGLGASGGSSLVVSNPFTIPVDSCPILITAIVDVDNDVAELIETNNTDILDVTADITSGVGCNGIGSSCNPFVVVKQSLVHLTTNIGNGGARDVGNIAVKYTLNNVQVGSDVVPAIAAHSSAGSGFYHTFASAGSYVITVIPDSGNLICERNEGNNNGAIYVTVLEGLPDLEILAQHISPSNLNPNLNQSVTVVASIFNTGTLVSAPTTVRFYVDNVQLGADVPLDSIYAGRDTTVMATATYAATSVGPKIIRVVADAAQLVTELRENNNEATRAIIAGGAPDFAHSINEAITFSRTGFRRNEMVTIRNYIRNYGGDSGRAYLKYYITNPLGVKTLLDSVQFTLQPNDSMRVSKSWFVNMEGQGVITTEIAHSDPQEFNEFNNIDSLIFTAGPELNIASLNVADSILCEAEALSIGFTVHKGGQAVAYEWFKDGISTGNTSPSFFTNPAVTLTDAGNYSVWATDSFGVIQSPLKAIDVKPVLIPSITIAAYPGSVICDGTSVKFSATATNAGNTAAYQWLKNSVVVGQNEPIYIDTGLATNDAVICNVSSMDRCTVHTPVASNNVLMTVNPLSGALAGTNASQTYTVDSGMYLNYTDNGCQLIATVAAAMGNDLGPTTATTSINSNLTGFVQRFTEITPTYNLPAMVRLYFLQSEFDAYNLNAANTGQPLLPVSGSDPNVNNIVIYQYHGLPAGGNTGPGGQYDGSNYTVIRSNAISKIYNSASGYWEISFPVAGFSGHFLKAEAPVPLTIRLSDIKAVNVGSTNEISWATQHEDAGDYFELERSANGKDFKKIATFEGKGTAASYSFNDEKPVTGINYYRLRMYEGNGRSGLSKVVTATVAQGTFALEAYPNPAKDVLTVKTYGAAANGLIRITDIAGSTLKTIPASPEKTIVDITALAPGIYFMKYSDDVHAQTVRVVKE